MKRQKLIIVFIVIFALFFIIRRKIELSQAPVFGRQPVLVAVFHAQKKDLRLFKDYLAEVEPENTAEISTRLNARVEKVFVDEGVYVKKGDLLAELDKKDVLAKLNAAKEKLSAAEENYNYWQKEYQRDEDLFKAGAISEEERDRARDSFAQSKADMTAAEENVKVWQNNLSYCEIKSPYAGMVSKRFVDAGDLAVIGHPLFIVEDRSRIKLAFDVPQQDMPFIKKGEAVFFKSGKQQAQAKIANIFPSLSSGKVLHIEAYPEKKLQLVVGEFVPVKVLVAEKKDAVVVPKAALVNLQGKKAFVFVVKGKKLEKQRVFLGLLTDNFAEVKNLSIGTAVVKNPYLSWVKLAEGETVKIMNSK